MPRFSIAEARQRQRKEALARANVVRKQRSDLKAGMKDGSINALALIEGRYDEYEHLIAGLKVERLILAVPMIGPRACDEIMETMGFGSRDEVRKLSYKQRKQLARLIVEAREVVV